MTSAVHPELSSTHWFKSSYSGHGSDCVEAAFLSDGTTAVRDSKRRQGPALLLTREEWTAFVISVRNEKFIRRGSASI